MNGETIINIIADVLLVLPILGVASSIFLWRVYRSDPIRPRSWVLFHLALGASVATTVAVLIAVLAIYRLSGTSLGSAGGLVLAVAVLVLELIPLWYAAAVWRLRRGFKPSFPPFKDNS